MRLKTTVTLAAVALALGVTSGAQAGTLEDVQARGVLRCVGSTGIAGFAKPDANGVWGALISTSAVPRLLLFLATRARLKL